MSGQNSRRHVISVDLISKLDKQMIPCNGRHRRLEGHPFQVRHKQHYNRRFILLLPQTAVLPRSNAGSDVIKSASSFVIQNRQTS